MNAILDIKINNDSIIEKFPIKSILITTGINKIPFCSIKIFDYNDIKNKLFIDEDIFKIGGKIEIEGENDKGELVKIFSGNIVNIALKLNKELDENFMELTSYVKSYEMDICKKSKCYLNKTDSEVIKEITSEYGLSAETESMEIKHEFIYQNNISDWDFINIIAENYGYITYIEEDKIIIGNPKTDNCTLETSIQSIITSNIEINGNSQISKIESKIWDIKSQSIKEINSENKNKNAFGNIKTNDLTTAANNPKTQILSNSVSEEEMKNILEGINNLNEYSKITGYITVYNGLNTKPNNSIKLDDYCKLFSGNGYISTVEYIYSGEDNCWTTKIYIGFKKNKLKNNRSNQNIYEFTSTIQGLKYGKVIKVEGDENSSYRVYVNIPTINNDNEGIWCRISSLYASSKGGILFLPEKDDEVVIGFIENNTSNPIILGSLYNDKNKPSVEFKNENDTKLIKTNSEMEIRFEEKDKNILIKTSDKKSIKISEKDKKIEIKSDEDNITIEDGAISIKCSKDISLKGNNITLNANGNVKISAASDLSIEGISTKIDGSMSTNIKGGSSAKLESSGITEIKGSLVNIN